MKLKNILPFALIFILVSVLFRGVFFLFRLDEPSFMKDFAIRLLLLALRIYISNEFLKKYRKKYPLKIKKYYNKSDFELILTKSDFQQISEGHWIKQILNLQIIVRKTSENTLMIRWINHENNLELSDNYNKYNNDTLGQVGLTDFLNSRLSHIMKSKQWLYIGKN